MYTGMVKTQSPRNTVDSGDQIDIELDAQDIEKLYEPLVSLANIY